MRHYFPMFPMVWVAIAMQVIACSGKAKQQEAAPETYTVIQPALVDTIFTKEYIAEIHSLQNVEIRTHVKGFIEKIHIDEGKPVQAGQILFTLSNREFRENLLKALANYKSAFAELKVAEVELKNTRTLAEKNIVSSSELDMALARKEAIEAKLEEAQSAISIARLNLSFTEVKAPFTGVINRIPFKTGSLVGEGDLLTKISNNKEVFAYFNMSEKEFIDLMEKDSSGLNKVVSLQLANNELFKYSGTIETVENEIDEGTGNIAFRARFKNPDQLLKHGSSGKILMKEALKQALVIPQKASFEIQDKVYVFTVDSSNTIRMRNINPRLRLPHLYVIGSGLEPRDRLIYEGIQQVKEGQRIQPKPLAFRDIHFD
ncbi:efflux RND transporter periplasmic adaptor subunit [Flavihumibacter profundi]|uniref:efflux RND transporter periplasmic adaptor subunit n=1 Tax=Flavihumibacter profundi TaxID=2716883 RepID=UPI001CC7B688|nr:efflux RND transporter periplasmic adaptor subunit [Flavihumibacter profundi]MBZ5857680.1 efflux RND transporter periplasmic adaptor subunit [Flavihumibacter profundi]